MKRRLTEAEVREVIKCREDPVYFLNTYAYILDPLYGIISLRLHLFQERVLARFLKTRFNIILKPRQVGMTWIVVGYLLWVALFYSDKKMLMISIKDDSAKALLARVKVIYDHLPEFLKVPTIENNMSKMIFETKSEIQSVPTSEQAGRSESLSLLVIDEAAHVRLFEKIWTSAYPALSTGGSAIVLSTPNGMSNFYYDLWTMATEGRSLFNPIRLYWYYYPGRDKEWLERELMNLSPMQAAQEIFADFLSSGNVVFDPTALRSLQDVCAMVHPEYMMYTEERDKKEACGLYLFKNPDPGKTYIMGVDPAQGGAGDFHASHVLEYESGEQVAEYRTRVPLEVFNRRIGELGQLYNNALIAVERNFGQATLIHLKSNSYHNIYQHQDLLHPDRPKDYGFPTNVQTRPLLIDEMEVAVREGVSGINGIRTVNEMMNFVWSKRGKAEASPGKNDDLVMSYAIARYVRNHSTVQYDMPFHVI